LVGKGKVRQAGRKGEEAARRQGLTFAFVGLLTHSQTEGAGDDGDDLGLRMRMRQNGVVLRQLEAKREQALLARIAVEHRSLCAGGNRWRRAPPFDLLRSDDAVPIRLLSRSRRADQGTDNCDR